MRYQHNLFTAKSTFSGLQFCRTHYGSIFIHLAVVASQNHESGEIPTKFDPTTVQGHPRSSIFVSMESPRDFYPPLPCLRPPLGGTPWNVGMKFGIRKLESWGYQKVKKSRR